MYRVSFDGAEPFGRECTTLDEAYEVVRATCGQFEVLQGGDDFWLCCRVAQDGASGDSQVLARIYLELGTASESPPLEEREPGPVSGARQPPTAGDTPTPPLGVRKITSG